MVSLIYLIDAALLGFAVSADLRAPMAMSKSSQVDIVSRKNA